ncbi:MAG: FtsW/RodA/SpoVE family cell cycle protein [Candidatus Liptonbacteria bacterium]|nr:FtsW/RodA/SpoVE family cell cycle protein [Candidatus Liptonbacteria bacterium]
MRMLLVSVGFLVLSSGVMLVSISRELFYLQLVWIVVGAGMVVFFSFFDWRAALNHHWVVWGLYGLALLLLLATLVFSPVIRGTRGWLLAGPLRFQPVELAKVALIFLYALYFSKRHLGIARWRYIFTSCVYFAIPAFLVALQPDLGSVLVLFGIWFGFLLVSGLPRRRLFFMLLFFAAAGFLLWQYGLADYQKERITGVFFPERDLLGINYSTRQSLIAVGSAGFFGKGFGQGTQTQLGFLTEPATDFIFAALIEEWGWLGGLLVLAAFLALIGAILKVGMLADRNYEKFICLGSATVMSWQFFLNAGSALGLVPVVGVTFPFLSYGGSSLLTNFFLLAIIHAIARRS